MTTLCVVGTGPQAAVVSACFADMGYRVTGVGDNAAEVEALNAANPPVAEPGLASILRRNLAAGHLHYTSDYTEALQGAQFAFLCIDTPVGEHDESDLGPVYSAAHKIGAALSTELILVVSAQVPVGTSEDLKAKICEASFARYVPAGPGADGEARRSPLEQNRPAQCQVEVTYVPEFLYLGSAVDSFLRPERIVIGAENQETAEQVAMLYHPLRRPTVITDVRSAEMARHACNAFLATAISFSNELARLCDETGADALEVGKIMRLDRRIGQHALLSPGLGFAAGTLGREIRALQRIGRAHSAPTPLLDAVMEVNLTRAQLVSERLEYIYAGQPLNELTVGILGLGDDGTPGVLQRSIGVAILRDLAGKKVGVKAFDPAPAWREASDLPPCVPVADAYAAAEHSDALVLVSAWDGYEALDLARLKASMRHPVFIDTRNLHDPAAMSNLGFVYSAIGRGTPLAQPRWTLKTRNGSLRDAPARPQ